MELDPEKVKIIQALVTLQCYTHIHDDLIHSKVLMQRSKQLSNQLVSELEKGPFKRLVGSLNKVDDMAYIDCIEVIESVTEKLARVPFNNWPDISNGLDNLLKEIKGLDKQTL